MRIVLKVRKKGILILPKKLRDKVGIKEGDEVLVEAREDRLIVKTLKPKVVDIDPNLVDKLLREEYYLEMKKYRRIFQREETGT